MNTAITSDLKEEFTLRKKAALVLDVLILAAIVVNAGCFTSEGGAFLFLTAVMVPLLSAAFIMLPLEHLSSKLPEWADLNKVFMVLSFSATPLVCFLVVFKSTGYSIREIIKFVLEKRLLFPASNIAAILVPFVLLFMITGRMKWTVLGTTIFWYIFAFVNYILVLFRDAPLSVSDFMSAGTAADVAGGYTLTLDKSALWSAAIAGAFIAAVLSLDDKIRLGIKARIAVFLLGLAYLGVFYRVYFDPAFTKKHDIRLARIWIKKNYRNQGYPFAFVLNVATARIEKPAGYSPAKASELASDLPSDKAAGKAEVSEETPNIIVIMNESLSDLSVLGEIKTKNDYIPFIHSLKDNTVKGRVHVSVFGGGTANSEFEFLTGNTMAFFPPYNAPFNTNVKESTPSLVRDLKQIGYGTAVAFHPGKYNSYNRNNAYPALGFDKFISREDLGKHEHVRKYTSDAADYKVVVREYKKFRASGSTSPFFMFNVTMQNHGGYGESAGVLDDQVHILDKEIDTVEVRNFLNLVKLSDDAFRDLVHYFEDVDEPTVILLYGDHEPMLGSAFNDTMKKRMKENGLSDIEIQEQRHQAVLCMWANFDIEEADDVDISLNYLSAFMMDKLGMPLTGYDKFRLKMYDEVPYYTYIAYKDGQGESGEVHSAETPMKGQPDIASDYKILQYNNVADPSHMADHFFRYDE